MPHSFCNSAAKAQGIALGFSISQKHRITRTQGRKDARTQGRKDARLTTLVFVVK